MRAADIGEMKMWYRQAADKHEQVYILADMFLCTPRDVCEVLGIAMPKRQRYCYRPRLWDDDMDARLLALCNGTRTMAEIADELGLVRGQVKSRITCLRREGHFCPVLTTRERAGGDCA